MIKIILCIIGFVIVMTLSQWSLYKAVIYLHDIVEQYDGRFTIRNKEFRKRIFSFSVWLTTWVLQVAMITIVFAKIVWR